MAANIKLPFQIKGTFSADLTSNQIARSALPYEGRLQNSTNGGTAMKARIFCYVLNAFINILFSMDVNGESTVLNVKVDLRDGSTIFGLMDRIAIPIKSDSIGKAELRMESVSGIAIDEDGDKVHVDFNNGDRISGSIDKATFNIKIKASSGDIVIPIKLAKKMTIVQSNIELVKDASADNPVNIPEIPVPQDGDDSVRGLSATVDWLILGRIHNAHTGKGYVEIYNRSTNSLMRTVQGNSQYFGHGIASDNVSFWTSDHADSCTVYQYDIATGNLVKQWKVGDFWPVRMVFDQNSGHLLITGYNESNVREYNQDGTQVRVISILNGGVNHSVKTGPNCWYVYSSPANYDSDRILYRYNKDWQLVGKSKAGWGNWDFDIRNSKVYYDSPDGYIQVRNFVP
jgi:hypothetical protein